jgi:hypothetical protein
MYNLGLYISKVGLVAAAFTAMRSKEAKVSVEFWAKVSFREGPFPRIKQGFE